MLALAILICSSLRTGFSWHAYRNSSERLEVSKLTASQECNKYKSSTTPKLLEKDNNMKLWPGLLHPRDVKIGETIYGFQEAMEIIWKNQHPPDCSTAKFVISSGWQGGFGSEVHVYGAGLALALDLGRVYIANPEGPVHIGLLDNTWQTRNPFCRSQNKLTLECYYEPWSSCSYKDALTGGMHVKHPNMLRLHDQDFKLRNDRNETLPQHIIDKIGDRRTIVYVHTGFGDSSHMLVPRPMKHLLHCSPMSPRFDYYWWRAVSAAYILRPNAATLDKLDSLRKVVLGDSCVAIYSRRGDKHVEMKLVSTDGYTTAAEMVWKLVEPMLKNRATGPPSPGNFTVFLASESPDVIKDGVQWGVSSGHKVLFTELFDRREVSAHLDYKAMRAKRLAGRIRHHDLEYLSMLLTLDLATRCQGWVCTLASNFCRLIDELRATVGGKANLPFADLSHETCASPPCIGPEHIKSFEWRR
eukprot:gene6580-13310_t